MKELRKSTANKAVISYYDLRSEYCGCHCMTYCAPEVSSWYPREANQNESQTLLVSYHNNYQP